MRFKNALLALAVAFSVGCSSIPDWVPGSGPEPTMKWEKRLESQQLYYSGPNYWWSTLSESQVHKALDAILEQGGDGPSIEFCGPPTADEYNGRPTPERIEVTYRKNIKRWKEVWEPALAARGLVAHIAFLNTNTKRNNTVSDAEWAKLANEFLDECGTKNKVVLPASETDPRTRSSIRSTLDRVFRSRMASRTLRYGGSSGLREYHSQRGNDIPRGNKDLFVVSDSGPAIAYLYGGAWRQGGSPNIGNITTYVSVGGGNGVTVVVYSFGRDFDFAGFKAAAKAWGKR